MGISIPVANNELYNVFESLGCWDRLDIFDYRFSSRHTETNEDMIIYKDDRFDLLGISFNLDIPNYVCLCFKLHIIII